MASSKRCPYLKVETHMLSADSYYCKSSSHPEYKPNQKHASISSTAFCKNGTFNSCPFYGNSSQGTRVCPYCHGTGRL